MNSKNVTIYFFLFIASTCIGQKLEKLGTAINSEFSETHPYITTDGQTLYFVRISHPSNNFGKESSNDVWYSELKSDNRWSLSRKMPNTINKDRYNDLFNITPDGNTALIRGVFVNGRKEDEIGLSICKKNGTNWGQPNKLDIPKLDVMCKGQFLTAYLSNNGKVLLLAFSEKKSSKEDDLYISTLDKLGKWSKPESLGSQINSGDIETTPFLASDNATLYFASDRSGGLGKMDIWVSKRKDKTWKNWSKPVNLGDKINSKEDDLFYSITASSEFAYMATKNNSIGKSDIVRFKLKNDILETPTVASLESSKANDEEIGSSTKNSKKDEELIDTSAPSSVVMISGKVIDSKTGNPIEAKIIYETLPDGEEAGIAYSNPTTGEYKIILPYGTRYSIRAEAKDFISISNNIDLTVQGKFKELKGEELKLAPIQTGVSITLNNIFFQFGKANLQEESFFELDRMVLSLKENPNMVIEIQGHTDNVGTEEANLKLSQERADTVRNYLIKKGISIEKVLSVGYGESRPIASNNTTEGQSKNRRVEIVIVKK
jgi:OmpA-OmpF porin, OOP family